MVANDLALIQRQGRPGYEKVWSAEVSPKRVQCLVQRIACALAHTLWREIEHRRVSADPASAGRGEKRQQGERTPFPDGWPNEPFARRFRQAPKQTDLNYRGYLMVV